MFVRRTLLAIVFLTTPVAANAVIVGELGSLPGTFLNLSTSGLEGGSLATLSGGTLYTSDQPFADIPAGGVFGQFLAAGPTSGDNATLTFASSGVQQLSFLWGSPDTYNVLTVADVTSALYVFTTASLGFPVSNGDQSFSQYVRFSAVGSNAAIRSVRFTSSLDAFEVANFRAVAVPGPIAGAGVLPLIGLAGLWFARRRVRKLAA